MKKILTITLAALLLAACTDSEKQLQKRAAELCKYIPDHELLEQSKDYMTADFYAVLDTMFNQLPEFEAMDHEWLYYFVTGNGGTIADYEVVGVEKTDKTHAVATIKVRQKWEDGSFDETTDVEEHKLYMEKVNGQWLMSDFDGHKQDCIENIANSRKEQALRNAISDYLVKEIGLQYSPGELCIPVLMLVSTEEQNAQKALVWGDFWMFNYNLVGDTLKTVSGGNHSGSMTVQKQGDKLTVTSFEQTEDGAGNEASAKRIFGKHFDVYQNMHSNQDVREAVRKEQLKEYVKQHELNVRYYQDFGWDAVAL
ncbi:MAG: hypothetical protein IKZ52_01330 [Bacteroidales bacterium]|nr:hypothetical protein [Bacteroidales bacterium]